MLRRVSAGVLVVAATALTALAFPAPARASDPEGWEPLKSYSFDDADRVPSGCSAYDGAPEGAQASYFRPEAVAVEAGHLSLSVHRRSYGGKSYVAGELRCTEVAQQFGRYEFKARVPVGAGIGSVALLRPVDVKAAGHDSQLEIMARPGAEQALVSNADGTATHTKDLPGQYSDWHTYRIDWDPSGFKLIIDGKLRWHDPSVSTEPRWFGFAVTTGDRAGTPAAATLPAEFQIDYLRVYSFAPREGADRGAAVPPAAEQALPPAPGGHPRWSLWLAVAALVAAALTLFGFVIHKTRPHRPKPGHRA